MDHSQIFWSIQDFDHLINFSQAQAILLDAQVQGYGGAGKVFDWSLLPPNVNAHLVLSGGLTPANVTDGILQVRPRCKSLAVDVSSGVEVDAAGPQPISARERIRAAHNATFDIDHGSWATRISD